MFFLFTKVDSISTAELENKLKENIQLIDVRTPGEFRRGHIKNAKNIPLNQISSFTPIADKKTYYYLLYTPIGYIKTWIQVFVKDDDYIIRNILYYM